MSRSYRTPRARLPREPTAPQAPSEGAASERLRAAADRVRAATRDPTHWEEEREADEAALREVVRAVEEIRAGRSAPRATDDIPQNLRFRRFASELALQVLSDRETAFEDESSPPAEATLDLLDALSVYRRALQEGEGTLLSGLTTPEALELVIEVAHDLRSPLNSILFLAEALRSGHSGPINDLQRSQLGLVYSATLGMISVVSDVMDLGRTGKSATDDDPVEFAIGETFEAVEELVAPMAEETEIRLAFRRPDYDRCIGYPIPLRRILLNLTTNALKFTDEGSVTVSAERVDRDTIEFSVRDTGRGLSDDQLADLFSPLRKSPSREGHFFSPTGLGLTIVRRLLAELGSTLEVESSPGEGTRFYFRLELPAE